MDWYPLWNSLRIAAISSVIVFFLGIFFAYYVAKLPRVLKGVLDVILTLPLVLPPTVVGYFLLLLFGVNRPLGQLLGTMGIRFVMTWYGGIVTASVVAVSYTHLDVYKRQGQVSFTPGKASVSRMVVQAPR